MNAPIASQNQLAPEPTGHLSNYALVRDNSFPDERSAQRRLGLYIHIPFCAQKCPYCDFNTYAGLENQIEGTVAALCQEMARRQTSLDGRTVDTIFLGGGTPTLLSGAQLAQLFTAIRSHFQLSPTCEITSEANPGTVDRAKFEILRGLGVNRLSIGVQSFQPAELSFLGRIHNVEDVIKAVGAARSAGFANINLDFIFGLPEQSLTHWQHTLEAAIALDPDHLSLYSLIVEPNTPLHHWVAQGKVAAPDEDVAAAHYEDAMQRLATAGYVQYEISNWAKNTAPAKVTGLVADPTAEDEIMPTFACQHNLIYWRNQEYLGIGPGAHSHLWFTDPEGRQHRRRWGNRKPVPGYVNRIHQGATVEEFSEEIEPRGAIGETMMLGLRLLQEGVPLRRFRAMHGSELQGLFAKELAQLQTWNLIEIDAKRIRLSARGVLLGNQVFSYFLPD